MPDDVESIKYFAYGSNMDKNQMERRGVFVFDSVKGKLPDHTLIFPVFSEGRGCGVADIIPAEDEVWGVVYTIDRRGMERLDMYENVYRKKKVDVHTDEGIIPAVTYIVDEPLEKKKDEHIAPSDKYLHHIINGAQEHGIEEDYIKRIERLR